MHNFATNHILGHADSAFGGMLAHLLHLNEKQSLQENRTNLKTVKDFGGMVVYDMADGFPIISMKKVHWKSVVHELIWFLNGGRNVKDLQAKGVTIWDEWAKEDGDLGPVYGVQWRNWELPGLDRCGRPNSYDQVAEVVKTLRSNPQSRRMIVSAWNPPDLKYMALEPCHVLWQLDVGADGRLNLLVFQRSADVFLGVPFNVASYALLLCVLAKMVGRQPGNLIHQMGNFHLYENQIQPAKDLIEKVKVAMTSPLFEDRLWLRPRLVLSDRVATLQDPSELQFEDCNLVDYTPWPAIKVDVAV